MKARDKLIRSEGIISVNMNTKQIIISQSMKLFGDYMNSSKDMIKNSVRKARPYKGWFSFYIDDEKRNYILRNTVLNSNSDSTETGRENPICLPTRSISFTISM